jgi:hypothetical protein
MSAVVGCIGTQRDLPSFPHRMCSNRLSRPTSERVTTVASAVLRPDEAINPKIAAQLAPRDRWECGNKCCGWDAATGVEDEVGVKGITHTLDLAWRQSTRATQNEVFDIRRSEIRNANRTCPESIGEKFRYIPPSCVAGTIGQSTNFRQGTIEILDLSGYCSRYGRDRPYASDTPHLKEKRHCRMEVGSRSPAFGGAMAMEQMTEEKAAYQCIVDFAKADSLSRDPVREMRKTAAIALHCVLRISTFG